MIALVYMPVMLARCGIARVPVWQVLHRAIGRYRQDQLAT